MADRLTDDEKKELRALTGMLRTDDFPDPTTVVLDLMVIKDSIPVATEIVELYRRYITRIEIQLRQLQQR